jgi:predicted Zn-dependent protease
MTALRSRRALLAALVVSPAAAGAAAWLALSPGCAVIESASDTLADATAGSAVSDVFRGAARAAESFKGYSPAQEYYIGRSVAAQVLQVYKVHPDRALQRYVNLVGYAVLAAPEAKRTLMGYRFIVVEGDGLQAVSTPGGFVFLTEGTVRRAKDEDELAGVLAHEVAHVSLDHGIGAIKAATRDRSFALLVKGAGGVASEAAGASGDAGTQDLVELTALFGDAISDITGELLVKGYSRDTEIAADAEAVKYLQSSGYSRAALVNYLSHVEAEGAGGKGGWYDTHPSAADRIAQIVESLGAPTAAALAATGSSPGRAVRLARFQAVPRG